MLATLPNLTKNCADRTEATLSLADWDQDGTIDMLVGSCDGLVHFFQGSQTATGISYAQLQGRVNPFNGIDVRANSAFRFSEPIQPIWMYQLVYQLSRRVYT